MTALVRFAGREGDEEIFHFDQTVPVIDAIGRHPPSEAQVAAAYD